jgi:hypothetical protein
LASTGEVPEALATIERLERNVDARLSAVVRVVAAAGGLAAGVRRDRARHRAERDELRRWLRLAAPAASAVAAEEPADASLEGLRAAQEALVHAHAEALPMLGDPRAVHRFGAHIVDLARHLAVIQLWIEMEEQRG